MEPPRMGPHAMKNDPPIWEEFRKIIKSRNPSVDLTKLERMAFYEAAGSKDVALTIATGEQRLFANVMVTIGVVM